MVATIIKLKNANFAGKGLPNINPFVAQAEAEFAFDFRNRADRLVDLAGRHTLTPHRNDIAANVKFTPDPTVVTTTADGLGVNVELGYLLTSKALAPIPIDGSVKFSVLVVGGFSGIAFPAGKVAGSAPNSSIMFDNGSRVTSFGFALEDEIGTIVKARIKSGPNSMFANKSASGKKTFTILTFDGSQWTWTNKTTGTVTTKTNADLGITGPIAVNSDSNVSKITVGHSHASSTLYAAYPSMYQLAYWNRVLTQAEIDDQYARSKANFVALGL